MGRRGALALLFVLLTALSAGAAGPPSPSLAELSTRAARSRAEQLGAGREHGASLEGGPSLRPASR
jgi:hypothetical protein